MRLIDADRFLSQIEDQYMEHDITREKYMDLEDRIMQQDTVNKVTPKEFRDRMKALTEESTPEEFHITADEYMCEVLTELGYGEGVAIFDGTEKWYS